MVTHIARDCQTSETFYLFTDDPKKELIEMFDRETSEPLMVNSKDGNQTFQIGWVIATRWLEVYKVTAMRVAQ